jgi:two-component system sensor histidine kinase ChiS
MRLMLIEDDPVFIKTLSDRLQDEGHSTREFLDPEEALEVLRRAPGDQEAILLDLRLPKMNGLQWLKKVRREGHPHPVVLISGDVSVEVTKEMVNLGLTAMLLKPFSSTELREVLMRLENALQSGNPIPLHTDLASSQAEDWKYEMVVLLQLAVDVWIRDGRELNALAVDSGCWTLTREQNHYRPKTLKNFLHLKTLPKRPKWQLVLRTAEYVLGECDTSPLSLELESKTKRFEKQILDIHPTLNETENKRSQNQSGKKK